ncbi:chemoreceptor glutamine deamidase CheD [bacterium]|nr:chemoreceptor glutamine deamidase CheD [bacterium]
MLERRKNDELPVDTYFHGTKRFHDAKEGIDVVKIFSGDWYVTKNCEMLATILGSCVAACIRDPIAHVGGMNHFLLPGDENTAVLSDAARYGVFAMESLINGILKAGGRKDRLEIKVFGGGNVINNSARIGSKNAAFIRSFLSKEGFTIASQDLEGDYPRRVHYYPQTGKALVRALKRREDMAVVQEEARYTRSINAKPIEGNIELF